MFSSLSASSLFPPLLLRDEFSLSAAYRSAVLHSKTRHICTDQLLLSASSLGFLLFLFCGFCGLFAVSSAASSPALPPAEGSPPPPPTYTEIATLLSLKAAWIDPLNRLASWDPVVSTLYCKHWLGVECSRKGSLVTSLKLVKLSLSGPLPASIAKLTSLRDLYLDFNYLTGNIPPELGSLSSLKVLRLRHNLFNGSIPENLFKATSLQYLFLESNNLSGNMSASVSNLVNLKYLSFGSNALSGPLPASIASLSNLVALFAGFNSIEGPIPSLLGEHCGFIHLDLQGNRLTERIPSWIGSCTGLRELRLNNNNLTGTLPENLGALHFLQILDLHLNNISGSISAPSWGNLTNLTVLDLSYNNLSGMIPTNGVLSKFSAGSFAGNPFLCGPPLANSQCVFSPPPTSPLSTSPPPTTLVHAPPPPRVPSLSVTPSGSDNKRKIVTGAVVSAAILLVLGVSSLFMLRKCMRLKETSQIQNLLSPGDSQNVGTSKLEMYVKGFKYCYEVIVSQAGYYDTAHVVGKGRFATVYRSDLPDGTQMAVKVFKNSIPEAAFEKEIEGLESASHFDTLLPIKGYFTSNGEKAIFYDFKRKGSLYDVLHKNPNAAAQLDWTKRLNIATGIAQAVTYLHKGSNLRVLHKDLKSTNVLLDENLYPLVSDYGLIGLVSKPLVETPGYTPPELKTIKKYTERTDVYSFGVVLLELLTGKKPVSHIGDRQLHLVTWALRLQSDGRGREVFSTNLVESCPFPDYPDRALNLAIWCLKDQPAQRPTISECANILEGLAINNSPMRSPEVRQDKPLLR